ncbi:DNA replication/repair protein RecF [Methyloglobulus sp.]|uniref:DNA replication/repair protein RecF n=1 Tax=Methyloglobulus sp. TaxID=2518622 RepID=UPI00398A4F19
MGLQRLDIYNIRNIREQSISPSPGLNFIYGKNASGKSALIEAIFLLGRAKSFRTSSIKSVISFEQDNLIVSAQAMQSKGGNLHLGIQMDGKNIEIRINQQPSQKRSDLAYGLPLQIIHPKSFELLDAGAQIRREFLDWGIFNHEENFLSVWRKYKRALAQRNALLKTRAISQLYVWNKELDNYGTMVNEYRLQYLQKLKPVLNKTIARFLTLRDIDIKLISGWDTARQLDQLLIEDLEKDLRYGFTHRGPHRGDFHLSIDNNLAKDVVSRGQLKLLVTCLKLAQVELIFRERDTFGCILMDDFAAELDKENRAKILNYLSEIQCQVFITATEVDDFGDLRSIENYKMFHVEQGKVRWINVPCGTSL